MEKFYNTNYEEQETNINISYPNSYLSVYTSRKINYERLKQKLGEPYRKYMINNQVSGGEWRIPFSDKKRLTSILSRPLLIGNIK